MRGAAAALVGAVLVVEAIGLAAIHFILGDVVDRQEMSLAGLDSGVMSGSTRGAGVVIGLYLLLCGAAALRAAFRDTAPGRYARVLLISCAVLHAVLATLAVGLVGWAAFVLLMVVFGLLVLVLVSENGAAGTAAEKRGAEPEGPGPERDPEPVAPAP